MPSRDSNDVIITAQPPQPTGGARDSNDVIITSQPPRPTGNARDSNDLLQFGVVPLRPSKARDSQDVLIFGVSPMALSFPLALPSKPGPRTLKLAPNNAIAISLNPFTEQAQLQEWSGEWWELELGYPPLPATIAGAWCGFLAGLRSGTFQFGPPQVNPAGALRVPTNAPKVRTAAVAGDRTLHLNVTGLNSNPTVLKAGDYFQVGTGSTARLHIATIDAASSSTGDVDVEIFPAIREPLAVNYAAIVVASPVGTFRLSEFRREWTLDYTRTFGLGIKAHEAI